MHHSNAMLLLQGIRVLSLAVNVPGPVAAARLRELGAEVTRVEPPAGDPLAAGCPSWYDALVRDQEVITLDLKNPDVRGRFDAMLAGHDLLLTAMRPAALERLGLSAAALRARYPRLCTVALTGHPAPHGDRVGHDLTYQAAAGLVRPPALPSTLVADLVAAERAVAAAAALLLARERHGAGGYAEVAIAEVAEAVAAPLRHGLTREGGALGGGLPVYALYPAAEGWVALAALEPHFRDRLLQELELPGPDPAGFEAAFRARPAAEWEAWARARHLPIVAVRGADGPPRGGAGDEEETAR